MHDGHSLSHRNKIFLDRSSPFFRNIHIFRVEFDANTFSIKFKRHFTDSPSPVKRI